MEPNADGLEVFYNTFREISKAVHSSTDLKEVLDLVVCKAAEALGAKGAILRILNLDTDELELSAAYNLSAAYLAKGPVSQKNLITDLYEKRRVIVIEDIHNDPRIHYPQEAASEEMKDKFDLLALQTEKLSALGRMAAGIAHEINNPLAGILLFSSNLFKKVPDEGSLKERLGIIMRETQRCKFIIQELLEFARDKEPRKTAASITAILQKSLNILENEFRLRHIRIEKELAPDLPESCVDANHIEQVFVNLLLNAAQAIDDNGTITLRARANPARR